MLRCLSALLMAALLLSVPAAAADYGASAVEDALPEAARDIVGGSALESAAQPEGMLSRLWEAALEGYTGGLRLSLTYYPQINTFRGQEQMQVVITGYCK